MDRLKNRFFHRWPTQIHFMHKQIIAALMLCLAGGTLFAEDENTFQLVDCGKNDKVVLFPGTTSPDGRFAFGWTLRPRRSAASPVEWLEYRGGDAVPGILEKYDFIWEGRYSDLDKPTEKGGPPYRLLNVIVDLSQKRAQLIPTDYPYFPNKNHAELKVVWGPAKGGVDCAVMGIDTRFSTEKLWLITARDSGIQLLEESKELGKRVEAILKEKRPLSYSAYDTVWLSAEVKSGVFSEDGVHLDFSAGIPKRDYEGVDGVVVVDPVTGNILKTVCDAKRDDPFMDNPELAKADKELNRVYAKLQVQLDSKHQAALKKEQLAWLEERDSGNCPEVGWGESEEEFNQKRDQSLIASTKERTAELAKRLN